MGLIIVKNANGTTKDPKCTEGAYWIDHWSNFMNFTRAVCSRKDCCKTTELVGGHVKKVDSDDNNKYIVPLCRECYKLSSDVVYEVNDNLLVPVSHSNWTAGKSCKKS